MPSLPSRSLTSWAAAPSLSLSLSPLSFLTLSPERWWTRRRVGETLAAWTLAADPAPHPKHGCARRRRLLGTSAVRVIQRQGQDGRRGGGGGRGEGGEHHCPSAPRQINVSGLAAPSAASSGGSAASSGAPYRLSQPREIEELRWEQEFAPPQLASPRKLDGVADDAAGKRLWLPAPARRFVPCVAPSPEYRSPVVSRGYLLVHTNGGLNQMRSGDIWCYIHSLMPMRSAARAACVSHAFLRSWRCHPNLTFSARTLRSNKKEYEDDDIARDFCSKVDQILKRHSGIGVKKLNIQMCEGYNGYLDSWLQVAVKSGIEELSLKIPMIAKYSFPCSLLSNGSGDSIRYLHFTGCSFRPTTELGCLRSLTKLHLYHVSFTGDELGCLLSNSFALEVLGIRYCDGIGCLKVPCTLQRLRYLEVLGCCKLEMIESKAPNIFSFDYEGKRIQLSLGETLQMKELRLSFSGAVHYVCVELPSSMPNLKVATISSRREINTPLLHSKYLHLKSLTIFLCAATFPPAYDYFSLVSFFDGCPSLETLVLDVSQYEMEHVSIFTDSSGLRKMQGQQHHKMKTVKILGFTSAKSLVELTCHIVESMTSLECLTLETYQSSSRCFEPADKSNKCSPLPIHVLKEAQRGLVAIRMYIEPKVPAMVKLHVVETCRRCH